MRLLDALTVSPPSHYSVLYKIKFKLIFFKDFFVRLQRGEGAKGKGSQLYICVVCWAKLNKEGEMVAHR